jgi:hypothetical protein
MTTTFQLRCGGIVSHSCHPERRESMQMSQLTPSRRHRHRPPRPKKKPKQPGGLLDGTSKSLIPLMIGVSILPPTHPLRRPNRQVQCAGRYARRNRGRHAPVYSRSRHDVDSRAGSGRRGGKLDPVASAWKNDAIATSQKGGGGFLDWRDGMG